MKFFQGLLWITTVLMPRFAYAQTPSLIPEDGVPGCDFDTGVIHAECIPMYLSYLIKTIFGLTGAFFLLMIIWSGYQFALKGITQDDTGAKERLKNAITGFIVCALSFFIIDFIISTLAGL